MKKSAFISLALALGFGSLAYAEPPGDVQDPRKQSPQKKDHFGQWLDNDGFVTPGPKIKNLIDSDRDRIDDRLQAGAGEPAGKARPEVEKPEKPDPVAEYRNLEKALAGNKAHSAKAERDLEVKIAELRKNPDKNEVEIGVKKARSEHDAAMKGHERETKHIESRLAELKEIPEVVICIFPPKPERKPFPPHWGRPPAIQTKDLRPLPGNFGPERGSSTLCAWVERNIKSDLANKDKPKPEPKRPPVVRPPAPPRPEISQETKADLAGIEKDKADLFKAMRVELGKLEKGSTKEDVRKAVEQFKKDNADKFTEIKAASDKVHEELKAKRPERKKRPEPPAEVKAKIADVKKAEKQIHQARRTVSNELKKAQDELAAKIAEAKKNPDKNEVAIEIKNLVAEQAAARKAALDAFKESQKEKHKELKGAQKDLRETIRATKEEGESRTSR